ncbi:uncharacterized protein F5891DRAFT_1197817 [Suillus fuscotomentosus]|uniref:BAH domain-containing protein n=1 Tax=Suillus fuscotomentosus TaxID=1912939 RepID=A0AAD4DR83_9AGAM|nr:uncharacterized protein F5891DRAFT_1197817 [Suillus fuscotomentosus]KAG1890737.1 hypothetical protein F5891DRAFT_1197817 [Suillus fuscotomentosus]
MSELPKGMSLKKFNDLPTTRAILYYLDSDEEGENKIEYEVGQSVSVYASKEGRKGVDPNDLWYAIIECIRVDKRARASEHFWVKIRWYWRADFEEPIFKKASQSDSRLLCMGRQELLESDLSIWAEAKVLAGENNPQLL